MNSFVTMLQNVGANSRHMLNGDSGTWAGNETQNSNSVSVQPSSKDDDTMDTLSPTDSDSSKHSPVDNSNAENLKELSVSKDPDQQSTLTCPISVEASQHSSNSNSASQTPSSANSTPQHSPNNNQLNVVKEKNGNIENQSGLLDVCKVEPSSSGLGYQNLKIEVTEGVIAANASFRSFDDFERVFNHWKATYLHPFRVASSEQLRNADGTVDEVFKYKYIVYHCAHYGKPRMRGSGKRPNQNYLPCGCKAMLRLNYAYNTGLRITTLNDKHFGHEVTPENYAKSCSKIRRFSPKISFEKKVANWQGQQQIGNCDLKYDISTATGGATANNCNNNALSVLSHIQELNSENLNISNEMDTSAYDSPLSSLAKNVARIGKATTSQNIFQSCQSPGTNGLQSLAAVAAAVGHQQQQQQVAAALLSQHKENMGFAFPNLSMMQQAQANPNPSLLPLIRGALGIPGFGSPLPFSLQSSINNAATNSTNEGGQSELHLSGSASTSPSLSNSQSIMAAAAAANAQRNQASSAFAQFLGYQQQQQYLQQQQNLAVAISLAQSLRTPFLNGSIVTPSSATPSDQQDIAQMPEPTQDPNYHRLPNNVQTSKPIDLSVASSTNVTAPTSSDSTKESDAFIQSLHLLQTQKGHLTAEEYNRKVAIVRNCVRHEFPSWDPKAFRT